MMTQPGSGQAVKWSSDHDSGHSITRSHLSTRLNYLRRIASAYLLRRRSHLTFWHETPELNEAGLASARAGRLGEYYMLFRQKADFPGQYDSSGIPLLDYHGKVGLQYNPIAIAQYGLGNYNLYKRTGDMTRIQNPKSKIQNPLVPGSVRRARFLRVAGWLVENLERNNQGVSVWNHHFDWEYRTPLRAPWYSALSQGQGLSVLLRAHQETRDSEFMDAAQRILTSFSKDVTQGGVGYADGEGHLWFEEAIVEPPTHILNGFIWAAWGIYDYWLHTRSADAQTLFAEAVRTLKDRLCLFDTGYWSLYEQSGTRLKMLASPFYHNLHLVQLDVMHHLTGEPTFADYFNRWTRYRNSPGNRALALAYKSLFKFLYY
jgi:heparosan-N-sulfate-glucuronate 5-epimerase